MSDNLFVTKTVVKLYVKSYLLFTRHLYLEMEKFKSQYKYVVDPLGTMLYMNKIEFDKKLFKNYDISFKESKEGQIYGVIQNKNYSINVSSIYQSDSTGSKFKLILDYVKDNMIS